MERGDLAEFRKKRNTDDDFPPNSKCGSENKKNATPVMIFLPIENVGRKITRRPLSSGIFSGTRIVKKQKQSSNSK